jgi:hypothetical protein
LEGGRFLMSGAALRLRLFFISYVPLFVTLMLRTTPDWSQLAHSNRDAIAPALFLALSLAGLALTWELLRKPRRLSGTSLTVNEVSDAGAETAGYLGSYILPWIMFSETTWQVWAAFTAYMAVVTLVTTQSTLILVNPTLYLFRRRVVAIRVTQSRGPGHAFDVSTVLITAHVPLPLDQIRVVSIADGYMEKMT